MRVEPGHAREPVGVTRTLAAAREPSGAPAAVGAGVPRGHCPAAPSHGSPGWPGRLGWFDINLEALM